MREGSTRCARQPTRGQSSTRQVVSGLSPVVKPRKCLEEVGATGGRAPHTMQMNAGASWAQSKIWGRGCRGSARQQPFRNLTKRGLHRLCAPTETSNRAEAGHSTPAAAAAAEAPAAAGGRFQGRRGSRLCSHGGRVAGTGCAKKGDAWKGDGPKGEEVGACTRPKGLVVWVPRVTRPKGLAVWAPGSSLPKGCVLRGASCRVWRETPPRRLRWVRRRREGGFRGGGGGRA